MLTFARGVAGGPEAALRMARHLSEPTLPPSLARSHRRFARQPEAGDRCTAPVWRDDLDPAFYGLLGVDPARTLRLAEIAALLRGRRADGGRIPGKPASATAYTDLTFSAEKDLSILWALGTDAEQGVLAAIHRDAVSDTMAAIEAAIGRARLGHGGRDGIEPGRLAWLCFEQMTARAPAEEPDGSAGPGNPNIHSHVVVLHALLTASGRVRAPDLQGLARRIHGFGAIARGLTVRGLRRHGVAVEVDPELGTFRIPVVPPALRDAFSQRTLRGRAAAMAYLAADDEAWAALPERRRVALMKGGVQGRFSGVRKDDLADPEHWRRIARAHGWSPAPLLRRAAAPPPGPITARREAAAGRMLARLTPLLAGRSLVLHHEVWTIAAQVGVGAGLGAGEIASMIQTLSGREIQQDGARLPLRVIPALDRGGNAVTHLSTDLQPAERTALAGLLRAVLTPMPGSERAPDVPSGSVEILDAQTRDRWARAVEGAMRHGPNWCWIGGAAADGPADEHADMRHRTSLDDLRLSPAAWPARILIEDLGRHHPRDLFRFLQAARARPVRLKLFLRGDRTGFWTDTTRALLAEAWPHWVDAGRPTRAPEAVSPDGPVLDGTIEDVVARARRTGRAQLLDGAEDAFARQVADRWLLERERGADPVIVTATGFARASIVTLLRDEMRRRGLLEGPDHAVRLTTISSGNAITTEDSITLAIGDRVVLDKRCNARRDDGGRGLFGVPGTRLTVVGITHEGIRAVNPRGHAGMIAWSTLRAVGGGYALTQGYVVSADKDRAASTCQIWAVDAEVPTLGAAWLRAQANPKRRDQLLVARAALGSAWEQGAPGFDDGGWEALSSLIQTGLATDAERAWRNALASRGAAADAFRRCLVRLDVSVRSGMVERRLRHARARIIEPHKPR